MIGVGCSVVAGWVFCIDGRAVWQPLECQRYSVLRSLTPGPGMALGSKQIPTGDLVGLCAGLAPWMRHGTGHIGPEGTGCLIGGKPTQSKDWFRNLSLLSRARAAS